MTSDDSFFITSDNEAYAPKPEEIEYDWHNARLESVVYEQDEENQRYKYDKMKYNIIRNKDKARQLIGGTSRKDRLNGWSYKQLVQAFGNPTFSNPSGDNKVQKEWVFQRNSDGVTFTIYDWLSKTEDYVMNFNTNWNVGSKEYAGEFVEDLIKELKRKN